jgi:hypothetical protein
MFLLQKRFKMSRKVAYRPVTRSASGLDISEPEFIDLNANDDIAQFQKLVEAKLSVGRLVSVYRFVNTVQSQFKV